MSQNQQLFKKQVLQDAIWGILQQYIFASPFRPFGEEGRKLENAWRDMDPEIKAKEDIGGVYTWPKPTAETERWRYINITEGRAAFTQATVSEWDPRAKLRIGLESVIDSLKKELASSLEEIVGSRRDDGHYLRTLEELPRKAVNMWLTFGIQRCRVRVIVREPHLTAATEKIRQAMAGGWELVIIPELQRVGTAKGSDLRAKPHRISDGQIYLVSPARRQ
ncbi:hypothetical protein D0Z07_8513 [Hyphodiscus hymeniophilus]|uniref:Uncharacterized protein n=1 Tax=Hyphodiscus hymeniophilus TaxID=353542 RepID=A0A9P6SLU1_9HELO|nr:hypothetical protein D0Z07_8513 [Hyphodiscus hymeniophilus]